MAAIGAIYEPTFFTRDSVSEEPYRVRRVSVASAGFAYHGIQTSKDLVRVLLQGGSRSDAERETQFDLQYLQTAAGLQHREGRKLDRFSLLALAGARAAIIGSHMRPNNTSQCGIYAGGMFGGWTFTEPQVRALHNDGIGAISPYLATAWFPGAPQGQISIHMQLTGFAKTVTTDRCCGAQAIGLAFERISEGLTPELMLAGAAEAPMTPFIQAALAQIPGHTVSVVEASAFLLLSAGDVSRVQIRDHSTFCNKLSASYAIERITKKTIEFVERLPKVPDVIMCNLPLMAGLENRVTKAIRPYVGQQGMLLFPTQVFGETLGASGALAAVAAREMLSTEYATSVLILSVGHQCGDLLLISREED